MRIDPEIESIHKLKRCNNQDREAVAGYLSISQYFNRLCEGRVDGLKSGRSF